MPQNSKLFARKATARQYTRATTLAGAAIVALLATGAIVQSQGHSFFALHYSGFTQDLFGVASNLQPPNLVLGGVATLPNGDVIAAECAQQPGTTRLHRFERNVSVADGHGGTIHAELVVPVTPPVPGCGITYHPDTSLYLNIDDGTYGVAKIDATTGVVISRVGPPGNTLGIAVDPRNNHLVYAGRGCRPTVGPTCTLIDLDPATGLATTRATFSLTEVGYVGGVSFDPSGDFIVLANRFPFWRLTILTRSGALVQHVPLPAEPEGLAFHADAPRFIVTNNTDVPSGDGTMTRIDFEDDDYSESATVSFFASGGFRGDLMQVGPDRCLYLTQEHTRFDDFMEAPNNSVVQICGGFAPPPGITPITSGTLRGRVTNASTGSPIAGATVVVTNGTTVSATTSSDGQYSLEVTAGTYTATASASGFDDRSAMVVITALGTTTRDFALTPKPPPPGKLTGVVFNAMTGAPVAGATVQVSNGASATTSADGRYSIALEAGTYSASATAPGFEVRVESGITIASSGTTLRDFPLTPKPPPVDPCKAANTFFGLGAAGGYTIFGAGCGSNTDISGRLTVIAGDVGSGPLTDLWLQSGTIKGKVVVDPSAWVGQKNIIIQGGIVKKRLKSVADSLAPASARLAKLKPTRTLKPITKSITIVGNGGVNVIRIPSVDLDCAIIEIKGKASDIFVFNVTGGFTLNASHIHLSGGVLPCNILWNFVTPRDCPLDVTVGDGSEAAGIFLAPARYVDIQDSALMGRVLAGSDITIFASTVKP